MKSVLMKKWLYILITGVLATIYLFSGWVLALIRKASDKNYLPRGSPEGCLLQARKEVERIQMILRIDEFFGLKQVMRKDPRGKV